MAHKRCSILLLIHFYISVSPINTSIFYLSDVLNTLTKYNKIWNKRKYWESLCYSTFSCKLRKSISISKDQLFAGEYTNEFRSKVFVCTSNCMSLLTKESGVIWFKSACSRFRVSHTDSRIETWACYYAPIYLFWG